ncbi:MAG TPA: molybdopterin-dependent oxidoreductase [Pseudonocardiaceae bacterium]
MFNVPRLVALLAALLALPLLLTGAARTPAAQASPSGPTFVVDGRVAHPATLSVADLRRLPAHHEVVRFVAAGKQEVHRFDGPLLVDVITAAKPQFDPAVKHDELRHAVLVGATDGYRAALSWGEIDPGFAGTEVLLASEQDGHRLDRPRLVVPGDKEGGRYVTDVSSVSLLRLGG